MYDKRWPIAEGADMINDGLAGYTQSQR